jgi:biotin carboxylase
VMETAARLGGGFITSHLTPASTGVDLVGACIDIALGDTPDLTPKQPPSPCAIRFIAAPPGIVAGVEGLKGVRRCPGVTEAEIYVAAGDRVGELVDATARCGHVICTGQSTAEAVQRAVAAAGQLHIRIVPAAETTRVR